MLLRISNFFAIVMLSSFPFSFPIPLQSGQALHDALRFEAHLDHGEQQVEDVARRVNEKKATALHREAASTKP